MVQQRVAVDDPGAGHLVPAQVHGMTARTHRPGWVMQLPAVPAALDNEASLARREPISLVVLRQDRSGTPHRAVVAICSASLKLRPHHCPG